MKVKFTKKSRKNLKKSITKIGSVLFLLFIILGFSKIQGTNSFFTDSVTISGNTFSAGYWIPTLKMTVDPDPNDGLAGWYITKPCIKLESSLPDTTISYTLTDGSTTISGDYQDKCIEVSDGKWDFKAQGFYQNNPDWGSNVIDNEFDVDTANPVVKINDPDNNGTVSGTVSIKATITEANLKSYELRVEDKDGNPIKTKIVDTAGPISGDNIYNWDTTTSDFPDGDYKIVLTATDQAGLTGDDSINVTVKNTQEPPVVAPGDVIINEVMWMGSETDNGTKHTSDEWIELYNTTNKDIDIKGWNIYGAVSGSGGHLEISGHGSTAIIPAKGYYLIANKGKSDSAINVDVNETNTNINLANNYDDNGSLKLTDKTGSKVYDETLDPAGHAWPAGINDNDNNKKWSMERNDNPGTGWHTCDRDHMSLSDLNTMKDYWDGDAQKYNCGTPGHANLSENDPTSNDYVVEVQPVTNVAAAVNDNSVIEKMSDSGKITKKVPIKVVGTLDVADNLKYKIKQKIKRVDLLGDFTDKEINIDLAALGTIDKTGQIKIRIADLKLPDGVKVVSRKNKDLALLIAIKSGKQKSQKNGSNIIPTVSAALPKTDAANVSGDGDPNNNDKTAI